MLSRIADGWREPTPAVARLMLFAGAVLWSVGGLLIKEIETGAGNIVFFRCFFTALLLAPFLRGRRFPTLRDSLVAVGAFLLLLVLYVAATKETTAANAIFLQNTAPLYVILLTPLVLKERFRTSDIPPVAICLTGIAVLLVGNWSSGDAFGLLLAAASGAFFGFFFLWLRHMRYADPVAITAITCAGVAILLLPVPFFSPMDTRSLVLLVIMAAFQFALPYVLFTRGLAYVSGTEASLIALIEPVLNPVWVALFYGEDPSVATIVGGAIIVAGLAARYLVFRPPPEQAYVEAQGQAVVGD